MRRAQLVKTLNQKPMPTIARALPLALLFAVVFAGCHKKAAQRPAPKRINADSLLREQAKADSIARVEAARAAAAAAAAAAAKAGPPTTAPVSSAERAALAATIYFDLDE